MPTELEIGRLAGAIEYLGGRTTAEVVAKRASEAQWQDLLVWLEERRKLMKNSRLQAQIAQLQSEIEQ
jgi:hypothetical protein